MPHRIVSDPHIFPRMSKDMARHNKRVRDAIKKNLAHIISRQSIITGDRDKTVRVPIHQLKEYQFAFDYNHGVRVGHGDGRQKVTCPSCGGKGCEFCGSLGLVPKTRAKRIKEWLHDLKHGPFAPPITPFEVNDSLMANINDTPLDAEEHRKGKKGAPRTLPGDKIGKSKRGGGSGDGDGDGAGGIPKAGDQPGEDLYETEISIAELENIAFEALHLPNLEDKGTRKITRDQFRFDEIRKQGPLSSLDMKRTFIANVQRNAREKGQAEFGDVQREDMLFKRWEVEEEEEACAVVFALMDSSGSMDDWKKFIARTFFSWMVRFLQSQYDAVEIVFISHHTEAKEVDEEQFFHHAESGGTHMSSAWVLMNEIIRLRYSPSEWNIYAFHFSDGENFSNDNDDLIAAIEDTLSFKPSMLGYGEIGEEQPESDDDMMSLWYAGAHVFDLFKQKFIMRNPSPPFILCRIESEENVWEALKAFFSTRHKSTLETISGDSE